MKEVEQWAAELDALMERIGPRFARSEARQQAKAYLQGLCRVTLNKKGGNQHKIPYTMTCMYVHPPIDNVRPEFQVDAPDEATSDVMEIKTVAEATAQGHSLKLADLTPADGRDFLVSLTNHHDGMPLKAVSRIKYWNAIRSFSRFLHQTGLIEENIFLTIKKQ